MYLLYNVYIFLGYKTLTSALKKWFYFLCSAQWARAISSEYIYIKRQTKNVKKILNKLDSQKGIIKRGQREYKFTNTSTKRIYEYQILINFNLNNLKTYKTNPKKRMDFLNIKTKPLSWPKKPNPTKLFSRSDYFCFSCTPPEQGPTFTSQSLKSISPANVDWRMMADAIVT